MAPVQTVDQAGEEPGKPYAAATLDVGLARRIEGRIVLSPSISFRTGMNSVVRRSI
jgi:hypothetical protein